MGNIKSQCKKNIHDSDNYLLENGTINTKLFTLENLKCNAKCVKCYDADTIHIVIYFGNELQRFKCRLIGIDSAEIKSKNEKEKQHAIKAKEYLEKLILDKIIFVHCGLFDKYGRLLINIYYNDKNINTHLIDMKYAYAYDGKTKKDFNDWSIAAI